MDGPKSLDSLFKEKIFRIPDYQRGYAWQKNQLKDFWEDLINLSGDRSHYTGVLTLKAVDADKIRVDDNEYWLVEDHSYKMCHIVDGQQRLTTFVIFLQSFIDVIKMLDENFGKSDQEIYITESLNLKEVIKRYLYKIKPTGDQYRTYKFGYMVDNPSYEYLRYKIFNEDGSPSIKETFYTLNLKNAKLYFYEQLKELYSKFDLIGLQEIYKKLTKRFLFNEYVIKDEFDVFVAFETMNNRGKRLSNLELLKNRLIYLTTLYTDEELDDAERHSLRVAINDAWKEVYHQLGRNDKHPLNDDDFLRAHWIMYFQFSRQKGNDYIKFLLDENFSPQKVHNKIECEVCLDLPEEQRPDLEIDNTDSDDSNSEDSTDTKNDFRDREENNSDVKTVAHLQPLEIKKYVNSLKESAAHWFNSYYPHLATDLSDAEKKALERLNRIGMGYFRPLVMSLLKNETSAEKRIDFLDQIERFIFIVFRLNHNRRNYKDSEFYNASRELNQDKLTLEEIKERLNTNMSHCFHHDGTFNSKDFHHYLYKRFNSGTKSSGYYSWDGLHYFLYEYELNLLSKSRQKKVSWEEPSKAKISIEHIFPQTPTKNWKTLFSGIDENDCPRYSGSIGNLLLLSMSINSSLQNDNFKDKKNPKFNDAGEKIRNGYSDGSHSEIEVAQYDEWTPSHIKERGLRLLNFMQERWGIEFQSEKNKEALLFLDEKSENTPD